MKNSNFVNFTQAQLNNGFWYDRVLLNATTTVKSVMEQFENSGRFDALRFNFLKNGKRPHFFYDSDVAKWIEAVAYLAELKVEGIGEYLAVCEELIDCMEKAQREDGYLNSYFQQIEPDKIFKDRSCHELYCAGHLIEAAIAYSRATGKDKFLHIMERCCDCIYKAFISEKTASFTTPGHEEIELALLLLYEYTNNEKYLEMAGFFLENRGKEKPWKPLYDIYTEYGAQDDTDIYNLHFANGHSVRALYLYTAIADYARITDNPKLFNNLEDVFYDIINKKMYVTGGVGSTSIYEGFTLPYDLPNTTAYAESCCAIAMLMFIGRMRKINKNSDYGDTIERVLYNSLLSSTSLDGKAFFYENAMEIALEEHDREIGAPKNKRERRHPITERVEVFWCSCCPPNICRIFPQISGYIAVEDDNLTVEQYIPSRINSTFGEICILGDYVNQGKITVKSENYRGNRIDFRIPKWCKKLDVALNGENIKVDGCNGYFSLEVNESFTVDIDFNIQNRFVAANPNVTANLGRVALMRGPMVYCIEGVDNGDRLNKIEIDTEQLSKATMIEEFNGYYSITLPAYRMEESDIDDLYFSCENVKYKPVNVKFIPYFAFANRGESDMQVWVRKHIK